MKKVLLAIPIFLVAAFFGIGYLLSTTPTVEVQTPVSVVGNETPIAVRVSTPHGLRRFTASIEQSGKQHKVFETVNAKKRGVVFRQDEAPVEIKFNAGRKQAPELKDGPAKLIVEAAANDFANRTTTVTRDVQINTQPPIVSADGAQHYINQGGSELVTFNVSGYWTEAGVRVGKYTFRSFPMPGKTDPNTPERFSLFAFPWDVPADTVPVVYARNPSGAEATGLASGSRSFPNSSAPGNWRWRMRFFRRS
jgi:hypothetical protein